MTESGRAYFMAAYERVLAAMESERRVASMEEGIELEDIWERWDQWALDDAEPGDPTSWEEIAEQLSTVPPLPARVRLHPDDLAVLVAHLGGRDEEADVHIGRGYAPLDLRRVKVVIGLIQKRRSEQRRLKVERLPTALGLSYDAIAERAGLPRDRVKQIEGLITAGWNPRESHPEFPAKPGFVNLPTVAELGRLRRNGLFSG